jgi:hypothetical protein
MKRYSKGQKKKSNDLRIGNTNKINCSVMTAIMRESDVTLALRDRL